MATQFVKALVNPFHTSSTARSAVSNVMFVLRVLFGHQQGNYNEGVALILNYVVMNFEKDDNRTRIVEAWEKEFLRRAAAWDTESFDFVYFSEVS